MQNEPILDPARPIIDPHHHLWMKDGERYLLEELAADIAAGHNVRGTVYVECESMYRPSGPPAMRPVGEIEFACGVAAMSESGLFGKAKICAGIVGFADLRLTDSLEVLLHAEQQASGGRFRGIRHKVAADPNVLVHGKPRAPYQMRDPKFREGLRILSDMDLSFDVSPYHPQLEELLDLARAFPATEIILNHVGNPLGFGPYADRKKEVFEIWKTDIGKVAQCQNVTVKLGGLGMPRAGFGFESRASEVSSQELADAWRPYIETCIEAFGPDRSMFASNYPADKVSAGYSNIWNALKRIASSYSEAEKYKMFFGTAARVYRLTDVEA